VAGCGVQAYAAPFRYGGLRLRQGFAARVIRTIRQGGTELAAQRSVIDKSRTSLF